MAYPVSGHAGSAVAHEPVVPRREDPNLDLVGILRDFSHIYRDEPRQIAYRRAASVIAGTDEWIPEIARERRLAELPGIGPGIERLILEYLDHGFSPSLEQALAGASRERQRAVARRRGARANYLSVARAREVLLDERPGVVAVEDYRGDFQQHSRWSDGHETIEEIVADSISLGQRVAALTDHYGLPIARALDADDFARQHEEIERLNRRTGTVFRLLKGVEVNITADGRVDMPLAEMRMMDLVVASPHSLLHRQEDQTTRMVMAVCQPGVNILGHARGRRFSERPGVRARWREVFRAAAERRVAIEIDGTWERQDVDYELAREALEQGCLFALDSDAHSRRERHFSAIAIAHARLAGIPPDRIVNCWPLARVLEWAKAARG